jgi:hypothetical protein
MRILNRLAFPLALAAAALMETPATAQSFCDLVPASLVQSTLGIPGLTAAPNTEGGNGCDYKAMAAGPITIIADATEDSGLYSMVFTQRAANLGPGGVLVPGLGTAAYYIESHGEQIPQYPNLGYTKQVLVFRAKGKIVSYICMIPNNGVGKTAVLALGQATLSKPINTLKNP